MKPIPHTSPQFRRLAGECSPSQVRSTQPLTDYHFHAGKMAGGGRDGRPSSPIFAPGFRKLSYEFLGAETRRNYVAEVLLFAIIVGVSVWPIASMVQALGQLLK